MRPVPFVVACACAVASAGDPPAVTDYLRTVSVVAAIPGATPLDSDWATSDTTGPDTISARVRQTTTGQRTVADGQSTQSSTLRTGNSVALDLDNSVSVSNTEHPDDARPFAIASSEVFLDIEVFEETPYELDLTALPGFGFATQFSVRLTGPSGHVFNYNASLDRFRDDPQALTAEGMLPEGVYTFTARASFNVTGEEDGSASLVGSVLFGDDPTCSRADLASPLGVLDLADLVEFVTLFLAQEPRADLILNGVWDLDDLNDFIAAFTVGCP